MRLRCHRPKCGWGTSEYLGRSRMCDIVVEHRIGDSDVGDAPGLEVANHRSIVILYTMYYVNDNAYANIFVSHPSDAWLDTQDTSERPSHQNCSCSPFGSDNPISPQDLLTSFLLESFLRLITIAHLPLDGDAYGCWYRQRRAEITLISDTRRQPPLSVACGIPGFTGLCHFIPRNSSSRRRSFQYISSQGNLSSFL